MRQLRFPLTMTELEELRKEIAEIKTRYKRVEANKAWETSITRKVILMIVTYLVIGLTLMTINNPEPWKNAIIPSLGFLLSTLTLPFIKNFWQKYIYKI